jgi:dTDP-4-amino-4,6-dideoxygalactose transaminase
VSKIKAVITSKTKAIVPVCLFGQGVDISPLLTIAKEYNLVVIEDAAQALGARYKEKKVGSMGQAGCFSFFPTKNLGGYGDGGMVVTNDGDIYKKIKTLRVHGAEGKFLYGLIGGNFRLDEIQAAVLLVKLAYLDEWNKKRVAKAKNYFNLFKKANLLDKITPPFVALYNSHIFHQYVISALKRDALFNYLKKCGIGCAIYYPIPLHLQPCLCFLGYKKGDFPQAEKAAKKTLALPMYPELTTAQQEYVTNCIKKFYKNL